MKVLVLDNVAKPVKRLRQDAGLVSSGAPSGGPGTFSDPNFFTSGGAAASSSLGLASFSTGTAKKRGRAALEMNSMNSAPDRGNADLQDVSTFYQAVTKVPGFDFDMVRDLPCNSCRLRTRCDANAIYGSTPNPVSCRYLTEWLYHPNSTVAQGEVLSRGGGRGEASGGGAAGGKFVFARLGGGAGGGMKRGISSAGLSGAGVDMEDVL